MQVRAYRFWSSLLRTGHIPLIDDLPLDDLPDFGPSSLLVDLSGPRPVIPFLGDVLRAEAGLSAHGMTLDQVPARSLLSRLTDRCAQIVADRSAMGFEAEFINRNGRETLYRGLLLPFSSDGERADFVYGVISWKEGAVSGASLPLASLSPADCSILRSKPARPVWRDAAMSDWIQLGRKRN